MKVLMQNKREGYDIENVEQPIVGDNQILIKIVLSGICTNDIRDYYGENNYSLPRIGGHEYSGEIVEIGKNVDYEKFKLGDHVVSYIIPYCGECDFCLRGETNLCEKWQSSEIFYNDHGVSGFKGFSQYIAIDSKYVLKYPKQIGYETSIFTEPLGCVINSIHQANNLLPGDDVVVIGGGVMGMLHVMLLNQMGYNVILCEIDKNRLEDGLRFGAKYSVNSGNNNYVDKIFELTNGKGAAAVFNTTAISKIAEESIKLARQNGTVVMFSSIHPNKPILVDANYIHKSQINVTGANSPSLESFYEAINILSKKIIDVDSLLTKVYSYKEADEAIKFANSLNSYKVAINMQE